MICATEENLSHALLRHVPRLGPRHSTRESLLTRHGVLVVFGTLGEAEATAEDLPRPRVDREEWPYPLRQSASSRN